MREDTLSFKCISVRLGFLDDTEASGAARRYGERLEPLSIDLCVIGAVEVEVQRDRLMQPDTVAAVARFVRPGEEESLVASQLRNDDDLQVRECAILDLNGEFAVSVDQSSHRQCSISCAENGPRGPAPSQ